MSGSVANPEIPRGAGVNTSTTPGETSNPQGRRLSSFNIKSTSPPLQDAFRFWKEFSTANDAAVKKMMAAPDFVARVWSGIPDELRPTVWLRARTPDERQIGYDEAFANPTVVQEIEEELMFVRVPQDPNASFLHPTLSPTPTVQQSPLVPLDDTKKELIRNVLKIDASVFQLTAMRPGAVQLILRLLPVTKTVSNTVKVYQTLCRRMDSLWQNNHRKLYDMVLILAEIIAELPALAEQFRRTDFSVHDLATLMKEWILPVFACHFPVPFVLRAVDVALFDPRPQAFVALIYGMIKVAMPDLLSLPPAPKRHSAALAAAATSTSHLATPVSPINSSTGFDTSTSSGASSPSFLSPPPIHSQLGSSIGPENDVQLGGGATKSDTASNILTTTTSNTSVEQIQLQLQQTSPLLCLARIPLTTGNLTSAFAIGYDYVRSSLDECMARLKQKDWNQALSQPGLLKLEVGIGDVPVVAPTQRPLSYDGYCTTAAEIKQFFDYQREFKNDANRSRPSPMTYHPLHGVVDFFSPANDADTPLGGDLLSRLGTTLDVVDSKIRQRNRRARKMLEEEEERKRQEQERCRSELDDSKESSKNSNGTMIGGTQWNRSEPTLNNRMEISVNSTSSSMTAASVVSSPLAAVPTLQASGPSLRTMSNWTDRAQELLTQGDVHRLRGLLNQLTAKLDEIESISAAKSIAGSPMAATDGSSSAGTTLEFEQKSLGAGPSPAPVQPGPSAGVTASTPLQRRLGGGGHARNDSSLSMVTSTLSAPQMMTPLPAPCLSMGSASLQYESSKTGSAQVAAAQMASATQGSSTLASPETLPTSISQGIVRFSALSRLVTYPCIHMEGYLNRAKLSSADLSSSASTTSTEPLAVKLVSRYYILQGPYLTQFSKRLDLFPSRDISVDLRGRTITLVNNHPLGQYGIEILTHSGSTLYLLFANSEEERRMWIASFVSVSLLPGAGEASRH